MTDKVQLIKEEIERRISNLEQLGDRRYIEKYFTEQFRFIEVYEGLIKFIDSLPEEHNGDLEKEMKNFFDKLAIKESLSEGVPISEFDLKRTACHFAEWQKEKDEQEGKVLFEKSSGDCPKELIDIIDKEFGIDGRDENNNPLNGYGDWQCGMILNGPAISGLVKLGVEWQKQKDLEDSLKSDMTMPNKFYEKGKADAMNEMKETLQTEYEKGRFDMREEMIKDAQLGVIEERADGLLWWDTVYGTDKDYRNYLLSHFKNGDKVKIIILKTE